MFSSLAGLAMRRRKIILAVTLLFCAVAGAIGGTVTAKLSSGGYTVPSSQSARASAALTSRFRTAAPNLVIVVSTPGGPDSPSAAQRGAALTAQIAREPGVVSAWSYWSAGRPPALRSRTGNSALLLAVIGGGEDKAMANLREWQPRYASGFRGLRLTFGGQTEAYLEMNKQTTKDLAMAEILVLPITLLLLVFIFRGVIAALLPLALGVVAILGALAVLRVLVSFTHVSVFAENMATGLGLGLGIDYSLLIVSRYRDELAAGRTVPDAIGVSLRTAGRSVFFSALTVALALSAMLVFPMYFLQSFAYSGIAVVIFAAAAALITLPALLAVLGMRVNKWSLRRRPPKPVEQGMWHRLATLVMRQPVTFAVAVTVVLLALATPFLHIKFSLADARVLPASAQSHQVYRTLARDYPAQESEPILVLATRTGNPAQATTQISQYASSLSALRNVSQVTALTGTYVDGHRVAPPGPAAAQYAGTDSTWLSVIPTAGPYSQAGQQLVRTVRNAPAPFPIQVAGDAASFRDTMNVLYDRLPYVLIIIGLSIFVLLFLLTRSIVLPVKAFVLNLLSLTATFGAMVWVFQEGHLRNAVGGFTVTNSITATIPVLIFCVSFGLSMDYEVFLLSRIKEEYDERGDNTTAIARGLERAGRIVTPAALLVAVVFLSFLTSGISYMKLLGLGLALAVLMDATLIRGLLVPAFMRLAGRANWWAPPFLVRVHDRLGIAEETPTLEVPAGLGTSTRTP